MLRNRTERAVRLLDIMSLWWSGTRVADVAEKHGLSPQRTYRVLAEAGCGWQLRRWKRMSHFDDPTWRPSESEVGRAREAIAHPVFRKLTTRQRSALCWRAMGLNLGQISARMNLYPSVALECLAGALWRFEVLSKGWEERRMARRGKHADETAVADGLGQMGLEDYLKDLATDSATGEAH